MSTTPKCKRENNHRMTMIIILNYRCANTGLGDVVSELLSALLNRLTELEQHEEKLRACQSHVDEVKFIYSFNI